MPNFNATFPDYTGDYKKDFLNIQDTFISLKKSFDYHLSHLNEDNIYQMTGQNGDVIFDRLAFNNVYAIWFKNMCENSNFEVFDPDTLIPIGWTAGAVTTTANFFGTRSLKLVAGESTMQKYAVCVNPAWYADKSDTTRVSIYKKGGAVKVYVLDRDTDNPYTVTDKDGNSGTYIEFANNINWDAEMCTLTCVPTGATRIKLKFENSDATDDAYIDAVIVEPDYNGKQHSLYKDGPNSLGDGYGKELGSTSRSSTLVVAAHNATTKSRLGADYLCDGTADEVQINAAITALATTGGIVLLTEGSYEIADSINITSNIELRGMGMATDISIANGVNLDTGGMIAATSKTKFKIINMELNGNSGGVADGSTDDGIQLIGCSYFTIDGVYVYDMKRDGIHFELPQAGSAYSDCYVSRCYSVSNDRYGIYSSDMSNLYITDNLIFDNTNDGIYIDDSNDTRITHNIVANNANNITLYHCHNAIVTSNNLKNATASGILITGTTDKESENNNITDNIIFTNTYYGVSCGTYSGHNTFDGNYISHNDRQGIYLVGSVNNNIINNRVSDNGDGTDNTYSNIYLGTASSYNNIQGNYVWYDTAAARNPKYGIEINDSLSKFNSVSWNNNELGGKTGNFLDGGTNTIYPFNEKSTTKNTSIYVGYYVSPTGTCAVDAGSLTHIDGTGTDFLAKVSTNDYVGLYNGATAVEVRKVVSIESDVHLTVNTAFDGAFAGYVMRVYKKGNDSYDGTVADSTHALLTIQAAVNLIPPVVNHVVQIYVVPGEYTSEWLAINYLSGNGSLELNNTFATYTSADVNTLLQINGFEIDTCTVPINIYGISTLLGNLITKCDMVRIYSLSLVAAVAEWGVDCYNNSYVYIINSVISNQEYAIVAETGARVTSRNNSGSGNDYGLYVYYAGQIHKRGTQPSGTIANELSEYGGVIFPIDSTQIIVTTPIGYAEMYMHDNVTVCPIDVADVYHAVYHTFGNNDGVLAPVIDTTYFTRKLGVGYAIASVATYDGGAKIQCTVTAGHALLEGEPVTITGSANYDGTYLVLGAGLTATEFVVTKAYAATNTGSVRRPATLKCLVAGIYEAAFSVSGTPATPNDNFKWELNKDITPLSNIAAQAIWSSATKYESVGSHGLVSLTAEYVWLSVKNYTGTGDLTISSANVNLHRII